MVRNLMIWVMLFNLLHLDDVVTSLQSQESFSGIPSNNLEICDVWNTGKHMFISTTEGHKLYSFDLSSQSRPSLNEAIFLEGELRFEIFKIDKIHDGSFLPFFFGFIFPNKTGNKLSVENKTK